MTQIRGQERKGAEGRQEAEGGKDQAAARPLTKAGGEVWAGAVSWRTDALEGAIGVGTNAALAKVFLAALIHVCETGRKPGPPTFLLNLPGHAAPSPFPRPSGSKAFNCSAICFGSSLPCKPHPSDARPFQSLPNYPDSAPAPLSKPRLSLLWPSPTSPAPIVHLDSLFHPLLVLPWPL